MTTITNITALPTPPLRSDPTNFAQRADEFLAAFPTLQSEINSAGDLIEVAETNAVDAAATAVSARDVALVAQQGAIYAANAAPWVSGYSYAAEECAIDTTDHQTYRRKSAGSSTTTPSADPTNWAKLGLQLTEVIDQAHTFTAEQTFSQPIVGSTTTQVSKTGNETVAGVKTFSSSPVVPSGATGSQVPQAQEVLSRLNTTETIYTVTGTTPQLNGSNGTILDWSLTDNSTPTENLSDGQSIVLYIQDNGFTITWPSVIWKTDSGVAPDLTIGGRTFITLVKVASSLYGFRGGNY